MRWFRWFVCLMLLAVAPWPASAQMPPPDQDTLDHYAKDLIEALALQAYREGQLALRRGDVPEAIVQFEKAVRYAPQHAKYRQALQQARAQVTTPRP